MKKLLDIINEDFTMNNNVIVKGKNDYAYHPKNRAELRSLVNKLLYERGKDADLNDIDTSAIIDMANLFEGLDPHNIDISEWDVGNVKTMDGMFIMCQNFIGCDLSNWDVSSVETMVAMFENCEKFNSDISDWDVSNVRDMYEMFYDCFKFTGKGLDNWKVDNVYDMTNMFFDCKKLISTPKWYNKWDSNHVF